MFFFFAYGLGIHSTLSLPEFLAKEVGCDLSIDVHRHDREFLARSFGADDFEFTAGRAIIPIDRVGIFTVSGGQKIVIDALPQASDGQIRLFLVGSMMAIALYQRGQLVLHASGVRGERGAIVFLGAQGSGKSSLAAALHKRKYGIVSDDVTPVDVNSGSFLVSPGFPQLKLDPEAADILGYDAESQILLDLSEEKRGWRVRQGFSSDPLPLSRIYVVSDKVGNGVDSVGFQDAVLELVRHSAPTRWSQSGGADHFRQCTELAASVPVFRLERPKNISLLPRFAEFVDDHISLEMQ